MLKPTQLALILVAWLSGPLAAQVFDNTGNGMLNGPYYFREVLFTSTDEVAIYGSINFSGGTYTTTGAQIWKQQYAQSPTETWDSPLVYNGHVYIGTASWGDCPLTQS